MLISIAICTFNRSRSLERTLQSLANQTGVNWSQIEVIVVDNNCTDTTPEVVQSFEGKLPIRRVCETQQGLSHARNRALYSAGGAWIIFTDDDVYLDTGWLHAYLSAFDSNPEIHFAGGRIEPDWLGGTPGWYRGENLPLLDGVIARFDKGKIPFPIYNNEQLFFGANFALKSELVKLVGKFRTDLGMTGVGIGLGEETDFMLRARKLGAVGYYVADSLCWHPVDSRRLKILNLFRYGVASGIAHRAVADPSARGTLASAASYIVRGTYQLMKGRGDRLRQSIINAGIQVGLRKRKPEQQ